MVERFGVVERWSKPLTVAIVVLLLFSIALCLYLILLDLPFFVDHAANTVTAAATATTASAACVIAAACSHCYR